METFHLFTFLLDKGQGILNNVSLELLPLNSGLSLSQWGQTLYKNNANVYKTCI